MNDVKAPRPSALMLAAALAWFAGGALAADTVDVAGKVPEAKDIQEGLFPDDECEQLKAAGFKCMGFKPAVRFSLPAVSFKVGSADLPDLLKRQLDAFAEVLKIRGPSSQKVRVEGHADASGTPAANLELSQRRAEAAKLYLVDKGVRPDLLAAVGVGASEPKVSGNPLAAENRRVVIGREAEPAASAR
jgi:outer membrane protein OmpA-like peptidoglycan-associated protein